MCLLSVWLQMVVHGESEFIHSLMLIQISQVFNLYHNAVCSRIGVLYLRLSFLSMDQTQMILEYNDAFL